MGLYWSGMQGKCNKIMETAEMCEELSRKIYAGGGIPVINYMKQKYVDGGWSYH